MPKFFVKKENISSTQIVIQGEDSKHISGALRHKAGDSIIICDGEGTDYACTISQMDSGSVTCQIAASSRSLSEPTAKCTLFMAIPKGDKMELIIQKAVELGVSSIVPVQSKRCVVQIKEKDIEKKRERWQRISEAAAKQSGRGILPQVFSPVSFAKALQMMARHEHKAVFYESEHNSSISDYVNKSIVDFAFLIGPEGGLDADEILACQENNISVLSLGQRILRTETAPLCVLSIFMYITQNL